MHALGRGYVERGHEFLMVVPGATDSEQYTHGGRRVEIGSARIPLSGGYRAITRTAAVRDTISAFAPDVLEVSDRTTLRGFGPWARAAGVPATFFAHERADRVLHALLPRPVSAVVPTRRIADAHNRDIATRFDRIVCTTPFAAEEFVRIDRPVDLVPLGVDLDLFRPSLESEELRASLTHGSEALIVLASRLSREKRPDLAIDAVRTLVSRGMRVRLIIAGAGASESAMRSKARGLPVTFVGFVSDRDRFARLLATADVVVAPGPIETFGLAALESLASGTPAVVNAESALAQVVGDAGRTAASSAPAFADALEQVLNEDVHARSTAARARAETMPWSATVETMLSLHGARANIRHG